MSVYFTGEVRHSLNSCCSTESNCYAVFRRSHVRTSAQRPPLQLNAEIDLMLAEHIFEP
jgi:hypothetical protein